MQVCNWSADIANILFTSKIYGNSITPNTKACSGFLLEKYVDQEKMKLSSERLAISIPEIFTLFVTVN